MKRTYIVRRRRVIVTENVVRATSQEHAESLARLELIEGQYDAMQQEGVDRFEVSEAPAERRAA